MKEYCNYLISISKSATITNVCSSYKILNNLIIIIDNLNSKQINEVLNIEYQNILSVITFYNLKVELLNMKDFEKFNRKQKIEKITNESRR